MAFNWRNSRASVAAILLAAGFFISAPAALAEDGAQKGVVGGFEMFGYLSVGAGWQRFNNAPVTENTGSSFPGILGAVLSQNITGIPPNPGQSITEAFVEVLELDAVKHFGDRARVRADLIFGRNASGSWPFGQVNFQQAYAAVTLSQDRGVELLLGRFETLGGLEPYEPYNLDTISWSILGNTNSGPHIVTGAQISVDLSDSVLMQIGVNNGFTNDTTVRTNVLPSGYAGFEIKWDIEHRPARLVLLPFLGAESNSNRRPTYGINVVAEIPTGKWLKIGYEFLARRDQGAGGPTTDYLSSLINLHFDLTERLYTVLKYTFFDQFENGNGYINLSGQKQVINEMSLGGGYSITDGMKFKFETRVDVIDPAVGKLQWVPGVAIGLVCAF